MADIDLEQLKQFIIKANQPHATGSANITKEADGSRTIVFEDGDFKMNDNFFGGEPYGGRLAIFYKGEPAFLEAYYGRVYDTDTTVYDFLREALQHPGEDNPFRGPAEYRKGDLVYKSSTTGDVVYHEVKEFIYRGDKEIYSAIVDGGLVDQNARGSM
jgi:hypothetical protein